MPRRYIVPFDNVLVAAAQDLLQITGAAGKMFFLRRLWIGATDSLLVPAQSLQLRTRFLGATITPGSGGTSVTPQLADPGDHVASLTSLANNTSKATTTGTIYEWDNAGTHIWAGYDVQYPATKFPVGPSEAVVFELLSTVVGTVNLSGGAEVDEVGG